MYIELVNTHVSLQASTAQASLTRTCIFQALLDATYVTECRLVNEDFPQDKSKEEIRHLIGKLNGIIDRLSTCICFYVCLLLFFFFLIFSYLMSWYTLIYTIRCWNFIIIKINTGFKLYVTSICFLNFFFLY